MKTSTSTAIVAIRKLATSVVLGGLALWLPAPAMATEIVSLGCFDWDAGTSVSGMSLPGTVMGSKASRGFVPPGSCAAGQPSCAQCVADLLNAGFTMVFVQVNTATSIGDLTYLFKK